MKNILEVKNLNVYYTDKGSFFHGKKEEKHALKNVSFTMREGEILGLVGESGCGKTSLAKALLGMQKKYDGEIRLDCANPQMANRLDSGGASSYETCLFCRRKTT